MAKRVTHTLEDIRAFNKLAMNMVRPFGVSDARKSLSVGKGVVKGPQAYARKNPAVATTSPGAVSHQKAIAPPPVTS